jgi:SAM-dependent methyltransferase
MTEATPRFWEVFFEVFEALPRQGPGNRDCAARALALCRDLPSQPSVLDMGCGVGGQTLHLAELTSGFIVAIDNHAPFIDRLTATVAARGLTQRIRPLVADMTAAGSPPASFDLVRKRVYHCGQTDDIEKHLEQHNDPENTAKRQGRPTWLPITEQVDFSGRNITLGTT